MFHWSGAVRSDSTISSGAVMDTSGPGWKLSMEVMSTSRATVRSCGSTASRLSTSSGVTLAVDHEPSWAFPTMNVGSCCLSCSRRSSSVLS